METPHRPYSPSDRPDYRPALASWQVTDFGCSTNVAPQYVLGIFSVPFKSLGRSRLYFLQSACSCINFHPCMQTVILDRIRCCGEQSIWLGILYLCHRFQLTFYKWPSFLFDHCYIQSCRNILITGILF